MSLLNFSNRHQLSYRLSDPLRCRAHVPVVQVNVAQSHLDYRTNPTLRVKRSRSSIVSIRSAGSERQSSAIGLIVANRSSWSPIRTVVDISSRAG